MTFRLPNLRLTTRAVTVLAVLAAVAMFALAPGGGSVANAQEGVPDKPKDLTGRLLQFGSAELDWKDVQGAETYEAQYWDNTDTSNNFWADPPSVEYDGSSAVLSGLPNQHVFYFQVRARNPVGPSEWSDYIRVTNPGGRGWRPTIVNICDRTPQVRDATLAKLPGVSDCSVVTDVDLGGIKQEIDLTGQNISELKAADFQGLTRLQSLRLNNNDLTILPDNVFDGLTSLEWLKLKNNDLSELPDNVFDDLASLRSLSLDDNDLGELPDNVFDGLANLSSLSLDGNDLGELPDNVFDGLANLSSLSLDGNDLGELPDNVFDDLTRLEGLYLRDNDLEEMPSRVFDDLSSLEFLALGDNSLSELPPGVFDGLAKLQELSLTRNDLGELPDNVFDDLAEVATLSLDGNDLKELPPGVFDGLSNLEWLQLGSNDLSELPDGVFDGLSKLEDLYLYDNDLRELPAGVFDGLSKLERLQLGSNDLSELPDGVLDGLSKLEYLYLYDNDLRELPAGMFEGIHGLKGLYLTKNPGSTFVLTAELERRGDDEFVVKVAQGAPFKITVTLSAQGGTLSPTYVEILGGRTTSGPIFIRSVEPEASQVTISVDSTAFTDYLGIGVGLPSVHGIQTGPGAPLVIGEAEPVNTPATGAPTISGTTQVGETLTASTSGIADADGLSGAIFSYQWLSSRDTEIQGATDVSYTIVAADEGKTIKVRVTFTDDTGHEETLTSAPTAAVAAAAQDNSEDEPSLRSYMTVVVTEDDSDPDNVVTSFTITYNDSDDCSASHNAYLDGVAGDPIHLGSATMESEQIASSLTNPQAKHIGFNGAMYKVDLYCGTIDSGRRVSSLLIDSHSRPYRPQPGTYSTEPSLTGLAISPGTLTPAFSPTTYDYTLSGITHDDTLSTTTVTLNSGYSVTFCSHNFSGCLDRGNGVYESLNRVGDNTITLDVKGDSTDTSEVYTITFTRPEETITISGLAEQRYLEEYSQAIGTYTGPPVPDDHGGPWLKWSLSGEDSDDFELTSSRDVKIWPGKGTISNAEVKLWFASTPDYENPTDADGDNVYNVTIEATSSYFISGSLDITVTVDNVPEQVNTPATGAPTIGGKVQVGETLTASTSGIADADGLTGVTYSYQWLSSRDTEIQGATGATFTLRSDDAGNIIKVRVTFTDDGGSEETLTSEPTAAVSAVPPGAPTSVAAYSIATGDLEVRWSSSDFATTTSFKVQWKSGAQEYDTLRQATVDPATSLEQGQTTASGRRYKHTITGLIDDTEYTVRVIATNATADSDPSPDAAGTPQATPGQASLFIENEVVKVHESAFPWLREAWTFISEQSVEIDMDTSSGGSLTVWCSPHRPMESHLRRCYVERMNIGRGTQRVLIPVITHELAHVITLGNSVAASPGPLGIAHLYLNQLNFESPTCDVRELYADLLMVLVHGDSVRPGINFWCPDTTDSKIDEALAVMRSAVAGEMPSWLSATYSDANGDLDLEQVWADVKAITGPFLDSRAAVVFQLRDTFGGYCDNRKATDSAFDSGPTRNPWLDGGCVPDAPVSLEVTAGDAELSLSWETPEYDGGSPVEGYRVQWKSGAEEYDDTPTSTRQAEIADPASLTHTIAGLTNGVEYTVRVMAYNNNGVGTAQAGETLTSEPTAAVAASPDSGPAVTLRLSPSGSVAEGTEITVTMSFADLETDSDTSDTDYIFRADVVDADACEGGGMGNDRYMYKVDEDPEVRTGAISASCAPGDYTVEVSISSPGNVELASATADFTVNAPGQQQQPEPPSTDATLSGLTLSDVTLAFASATTRYSVSVANDVTQTTVTPTLSDDGATYAIKLGGVTDADGVIPLAVGSNVITVEVTAEDGNTVKTYTVTVTRAEPTVSGPAVTIGLSPSGSVAEGTEITVTMSFANLESDSDTSDTDYIFRADVRDADACEGGGMGNDRYMYKVDEDPEVRTGSISTSCAPGDYTVEVSISSPGNDELASATADFTVSTPAQQQPPPEPLASTDATLSNLALSNVDFGVFTSSTTGYAASVANYVTQTTVTPTVNDDGATYAIKLGGVTDDDGVIPLAVGSNVITIEVTAEDGNTTKTYKVTVTRTAPPPSTDTTLSSLTLSDAPFTFASDTTSYDVNVANGVDQTTVTATANDDGATYAVKLGGVADADGVIPLVVGSNVITIEVTAEDGETSKTYTVTVTRASPPPEPEPEPESTGERGAWLEQNPENKPFVGEWQHFTLRGSGLDKVNLSVNVIGFGGAPSSTGAVGYATASPLPAAGEVCGRRLLLGLPDEC